MTLKRSLTAILALSVITGLMFSACASAGTGQDEGVENTTVVDTAPQEGPDETPAECKICDYDYSSYAGELAREEIEGLLLALNDEYLASATYAGINEKFDSPRPFVNIKRAEDRHIERLAGLFESYGLKLPENKWIGKTPAFDSVKQACEAGVEGEIANMKLYTRLLKTTERDDILMVYRALQRASEENHLPAFKRCASRDGRFRRGRFGN